MRRFRHDGGDFALYFCAGDYLYLAVTFSDIPLAREKNS
jgi:hypothetical protein